MFRAKMERQPKKRKRKRKRKRKKTLQIMSSFVSTVPPPICPSSSRFLALRLHPNPNLSLTALPWRPPRSRPLIFRTPAAAALLLQDVGAAAVTSAGAYGLVLTFDNLTRRNIIEQVVHSLSSSGFDLNSVTVMSLNRSGEGEEVFDTIEGWYWEILMCLLLVLLKLC